jgi:hypothetical protein
VNSSVTIGGTAIALGASSSTITNDLSISGLTVGKGGGAVATNTAVGATALNATNTGGKCTAFGYQALKLTTGKENTAFGSDAGAAMTSGEGLAAFGWQAAKLNTGNNITSIGHNTLAANTSGNDNTAVGASVLASTTTGTTNTAVGSSALQSNTTASDNVAVGASALTSNTTGASNTAVGRVALFTNTTGANNIGIGSQALYYNTTASGNTAIGYQAGYAATTGTGQNVFVGYSAGSNLTTGDSNVYIGRNPQASGVAVGAETVIGNSLTGKGSQTAYIGGINGAYQGNNSANWSTTSDRRLKKNIVDNTDGLEKLLQIKVRNFEYRLPEEVTELPQEQAIQKQGVQLGVIAQELKEILPECVKTETTGVMTVDTDNLTWYLINAIKDLKALVDAQATEITALKAKVGI